MTDLDSFSSGLAEQIRADARDVVVPPVDRLRARARRRQASRVAGAALAVLAVVGAGALVAEGLPGGSRQGLIADAPAETVLDSGVDEDGPWQLVGRSQERCIELVRVRSQSGSCDLADPPRIDELSVQYVTDGGTPLTLVAGLAPAGTAAVDVTPSDGRRKESARIVTAGRDTYYVVRLPGLVGVDDIVATDSEGQVLDRLDPERRVPPPPPDALGGPVDSPTRPDGAVKAPSSNRIAETDEFGVLVAMRETPQGLEVDVNRVDMLVGQEAQDEATARGADYSNDYFLVDDNPMLRTYVIAPDAEVWGGLALGRDLEGERVSLSDLRAFVDRPHDAFAGTLFHLDVEGDLVVGIEEQYRP